MELEKDLKHCLDQNGYTSFDTLQVCTKGMHISSLGALELHRCEAVSLSRLVRSEQEQKCIRNSRRDERFGRANGREGEGECVQGELKCMTTTLYGAPNTSGGAELILNC